MIDRANITPVLVKRHKTQVSTQKSIRRASHVLFLALFLLIRPTTSFSILKQLGRTMGAAISTSQWYIYGKRHFTKTGYARHIKDYTDPVQANNLIRVGQQGEDGVNLGGKVVVVTGYVYFDYSLCLSFIAVSTERAII